jgi:hypothetical protein
MAVNVSASGKGGVSLGGNLDLSQLGGASSPAMGSAILFVVLIAIIVMIGLSLR